MALPHQQQKSAHTLIKAKQRQEYVSDKGTLLCREGPDSSRVDSAEMLPCVPLWEGGLGRALPAGPTGPCAAISGTRQPCARSREVGAIQFLELDVATFSRWAARTWLNRRPRWLIIFSYVSTFLFGSTLRRRPPPQPSQLPSPSVFHTRRCRLPEAGDMPVALLCTRS